ncbi:kinase-like protein [Auricularia subglabra TFB-10046 SS5]|uniref:Kinase-like protein n=1 Tax=Auricularia subglabra (strain TFB-10046 / SS5) TaxID=717982 RepID=J0LFU8_AURST|nr:kinase-like protein [Auricularia subglabra TFB-10046 SS5]
MADMPLGRGSTIFVRHFHQSQPIAVKVVSSVASGATARIYKGRAGPHGHQYEVALKIIPNLLDEKRQKVLEQLIRREVEAVSQLSNRAARGILPFLGTASAQFHMIIASKFMRNGNLLDYLKAAPGADPQHLVAETVHWLHVSHNLVHGDLKCENVLVNDAGDALLADFGLATLVEQESSALTTITAIRQMNTLPFAAPELLFGDDPDAAASNGEATGARPRSKTCRSDVYAFGMMTLQAFTGVRPWDGLNDHQIYGAHFRGTVHPRPPEAVANRELTDSW